MKRINKIFIIVTIALLLLVVSSCDSNKPIVLVTNMTVEKEAISFDLNIVDADRKIQGDTGKIIVEDEKGDLVVETKFKVSTVRGTPTPQSIKKLEISTKYIIKIQVTIKDEPTILYTSNVIETKGVNVREVYTKEELLASAKTDADNPFDEIMLMNDIDFEGEKITSSIGTLSNKVFNGNGKTIKNLHTSQALFSTIQSGSIVKDLTIENMILAGNKKEDGTYEKLVQNSSSSSRNYGLFASNISSTNSSTAATTVIENVNIIDSQMHLSVQNSSTQISQAIYIGAVSGQFYGHANNINVDNVLLDIESANATKLHIGGLFGFAGTTSTPSSSTKNHLDISEVSVNANINFNHVDSDKVKYNLPTTVKSLSREINIGLIAGSVKVFSGIRTKTIQDVVVKGNIDVNVGFIVKQFNNEDDAEELITQKRVHNVYVGGLIGLNDAALLKNIYYEGQVTFNRGDMIIKKDEEDTNEFSLYNQVSENFFIGSLFGENKTNQAHGFIIVESGSNIITTTEQADVTQYIKVDFLFGKTWSTKKETINYLENKKTVTYNGQELEYDKYLVIDVEEITSEFIKNFLKKYLKH